MDEDFAANLAGATKVWHGTINKSIFALDEWVVGQVPAIGGALKICLGIVGELDVLAMVHPGGVNGKLGGESGGLDKNCKVLLLLLLWGWWDLIAAVSWDGVNNWCDWWVWGGWDWWCC